MNAAWNTLSLRQFCDDQLSRAARPREQKIRWEILIWKFHVEVRAEGITNKTTYRE